MITLRLRGGTSVYYTQREMDAAFVSLAFSSHELHTHTRMYTVQSRRLANAQFRADESSTGFFRFVLLALVWYTKQVQEQIGRNFAVQKKPKNQKSTQAQPELHLTVRVTKSVV